MNKINKEILISHRLFVCNIPYSMNSVDLTAIFSVCGKVEYAIAIRDNVTGIPKGYGFVDMSTEEGLLNAIETINDREISGRKLQVTKAQERSNNERRPTAKIVGTGTCLLCGKNLTLVGFLEKKGICAVCAKIASNIHYHYERARGYIETPDQIPNFECILKG